MQYSFVIQFILNQFHYEGGVPMTSMQAALLLKFRQCNKNEHTAFLLLDNKDKENCLFYTESNLAGAETA